MNDELPEIFEQISPPPAPPALRARVLAAVEGELAKRRKPRWERVLELSVAASFVLGVGLNAELLVSGARGLTTLRANRTIDNQRDTLVADQTQEPGRDVELAYPRAGSFDEDYAKLLARLSEPPAG